MNILEIKKISIRKEGFLDKLNSTQDTKGKKDDSVSLKAGGEKRQLTQWPCRSLSQAGGRTLSPGMSRH